MYSILETIFIKFKGVLYSIPIKSKQNIITVGKKLSLVPGIHPMLSESFQVSRLAFLIAVGHWGY